jgi:hypothetical protein
VCSKKSKRAKKAANKRKKLRRAKARGRGLKPVSQARAIPSTSGAGMLGRILTYGEKIFGLCGGLRAVKDGRVKPRIPAGRVALAYLILMVTRLGSLHALEQRQTPAAWRAWLGGPLPSADVMGKVAATMRLDQLRALLRRQHARVKRNKGFGRDARGLRWLILDGHESVSSYRRSWKDCLERVVRFATGDRTQFYARFVLAFVTNRRTFFLLDLEAQLPGESESACALRLLTRIFERYPRAFDVVCGDNAYMDPKIWKRVRAHKKHLIAVLKNDARDLLVDARSLFADTRPISLDDKDKKVQRLCWDLDGFTTWPQCGEPVRVVRSLEYTTVKRQRTKQNETVETEWFWVTSLPSHLASTETIVRAGHGRWDIENHAFNELVNQWHGDHAYKYNAHALTACTLLLFLAVNLFHAFIERNLKPGLRAGRTAKYWAELIAAEFLLTFHRRAAPT